MKQPINQRKQMILPTAIAIIIFCAFGSAFAQGIGVKYAARDPRTCADKTSPKSGALTTAKAVERKNL